ncbi:MAG: hypothetical protein BWY94_01873 [Actinobacteria bacterium ADurb.BinA094]|nr:MAG: hypothetical protein BWY94_01873 [Actinobacteria bacterium ADurb.BinA094]
MAGAVARLALHAVAPALDGAVDDRRRLAGVELEGTPLCREYLLEIVPVADVDHVPVVQREELTRIPLHVVARKVALAADPVGVDRGLIPVEMYDHVPQRGGAGRGQGLGDAPRSEPSLALDDMHARGVGSVAVDGADGQADRAGEADPGGPCGELDEGGRRRRVSVQRLGAEPPEQRCRRDRVAPEPEQVLEAQASRRVGGQQLRSGAGGDFVPQRPHRVQAHGLVAGGVAHEVGVGSFRVAQVVIQRVEDDARHRPPRRDRAARMPRRRHVVEEDRAECAVEQVERLEVGELRRVRRSGRRQRRRDVDTDSPSRSQGERHRAAPFPRRSRRRGHALDCTTTRHSVDSGSRLIVTCRVTTPLEAAGPAASARCPDDEPVCTLRISPRSRRRRSRSGGPSRSRPTRAPCRSCWP